MRMGVVLPVASSRLLKKTHLRRCAPPPRSNVMLEYAFAWPVLSEAEGSVPRAPRIWDLFDQSGIRVSTALYTLSATGRKGFLRGNGKDSSGMESRQISTGDNKCA